MITKFDRLKCNCGNEVNATSVDYIIYHTEEGETKLRIKTRSHCNKCCDNIIHRVEFSLKGDHEECGNILRA